MNKTINFLSISICLSAILNANESAKITKEFQTPSKIQSAKLKQVSVIGKSFAPSQVPIRKSIIRKAQSVQTYAG